LRKEDVMRPIVIVGLLLLFTVSAFAQCGDDAMQVPQEKKVLMQEAPHADPAMEQLMTCTICGVDPTYELPSLFALSALLFGVMRVAVRVVFGRDELALLHIA
jgi:hypothetical protein